MFRVGRKRLLVHLDQMGLANGCNGLEGRKIARSRHESKLAHATCHGPARDQQHLPSGRAEGHELFGKIGDLIQIESSIVVCERTRTDFDDPSSRIGKYFSILR